MAANVFANSPMPAVNVARAPRRSPVALFRRQDMADPEPATPDSPEVPTLWTNLNAEELTAVSGRTVARMPRKRSR